MGFWDPQPKTLPQIETILRIVFHIQIEHGLVLVGFVGLTVPLTARTFGLLADSFSNGSLTRLSATSAGQLTEVVTFRLLVTSSLQSWRKCFVVLMDLTKYHTRKLESVRSLSWEGCINSVGETCIKKSATANKVNLACGIAHRGGMSLRDTTKAQTWDAQCRGSKFCGDRSACGSPQVCVPLLCAFSSWLGLEETDRVVNAGGGAALMAAGVHCVVPAQ